MTPATVACPNGHQNPPHLRYCGECGAQLPVSCPNGHRNPPDQHYCGECGVPLGHQEPQTGANPDQAAAEAAVPSYTPPVGPSYTPPVGPDTSPVPPQPGWGASHGHEDSGRSSHSYKWPTPPGTKVGDQDGTRRPWYRTKWAAPLIGVGILVLLMLLTPRDDNQPPASGDGQSQPPASGHSQSQPPASGQSQSYQKGYNDMINFTREGVASGNDQLRSMGEAPIDSPAQFLGPHGEKIAGLCEDNLQMTISGSTLGTKPQLPLDFSSADFLRGCNDAGKALLASGH